MKSALDRKRAFASVALTAVFNTVIALFLTYLDFGGGFPVNFIFSQSIGLSMCAFVLAGHFILRRSSLPVHNMLLVFILPVGAMAGSLIGAHIVRLTFPQSPEGMSVSLLQLLFIGILFGTIITYFFFSMGKISETKALLQEEQVKRLTQEKRTAETHLKLLQAQIEPHFLFNTLSNILSLLESDTAKGKGMLENLTRYLRASLSMTRKDLTTLGQELDLIAGYLDIFKTRLGERLRYMIAVPDTLREAPFPPMLIQPVVENALKHGIEPKTDGGELLIKVQDHGDCYHIIVSDTGAGASHEAGGGIGLANVRERMESLFHDKGRLVLEENKPSGLKVTLVIPHA